MDENTKRSYLDAKSRIELLTSDLIGLERDLDSLFKSVKSERTDNWVDKVVEILERMDTLAVARDALSSAVACYRAMGAK